MELENVKMDIIESNCKFNKENLIKGLEYITRLAKRVTQPPPKLSNDPKIDEYHDAIRSFIDQYGKSQV